MNMLAEEINSQAAKNQQIDQESNASQNELQEFVNELKAQEQTLRLDKETVKKLLELMSTRQNVLEKDREFIRYIIKELTGDLYNSKQAQAVVFIALTLAGGVVGGAGGIMGGANFGNFTQGAGKVLQSLGSVTQRSGDFSNQMFQNSQMWDEVNRQLRQGDHSGSDRSRETVQQQIQRILETINTQDATLNRARVR